VAAALRARRERYRPKAVAYTGIGVYKWFHATSKAAWGVQPASAVQGVTDVVVPLPSGLNRMRFEELVDHYRVLGPP
jgi:double-stranded uracil-DNA glycosylase